jgi:pyruvate kinase
MSIVAVTPNLDVARRMTLLWGAHSVQSRDVESYEEMVEVGTRETVEEGFAKTGDRIVIVAGIPFGETGSTNNIRIVTVR